MSEEKRIFVRLKFGEGAALKVGTLVQNGKQVFFRYDQDFVREGYSLSPYRLPFSTDIQEPGTRLFDGLFGVFADSLPDGWGRLLTDRALTAKGVNLDNVSVLDRLAMIGENGPGALCYYPESDWLPNHLGEIDLDNWADAAAQVLQGNEPDLLDALAKTAGSSGGARPKLLVSYNHSTGEIRPAGSGDLSDFDQWIIKFPATVDPADVANIEYAYYLMASKFGLEMETSRLFTGASGRQYFGTKRFDRNKQSRLHLHSAAGLFHDNFRATNLDYGHILNATKNLTGSIEQLDQVFRLAAFNVATHNHDDHSKNISFLMDGEGKWRFAPAYDLTFSRSTFGHHSMTVAGSTKPSWEDLERLAKEFGLENIVEIKHQLATVLNDWNGFTEKAGVGEASRRVIAKIIGI